MHFDLALLLLEHALDTQNLPKCYSYILKPILEKCIGLLGVCFLKGQPFS